MKNVLFLFALLFAVFACEKGENSEKLSDFIVGEWLLPSGTFGDNADIYGVGTFNDDGTYNLSIYQVNTTSPALLSVDANYSVDDAKDQLSLEEPNFEQGGGGTTGEYLLINVIWTPKGNTMTWDMPDGEQTITLTRR